MRTVAERTRRTTMSAMMVGCVRAPSRREGLGVGGLVRAPSRREGLASSTSSMRWRAFSSFSWIRCASASSCSLKQVAGRRLHGG